MSSRYEWTVGLRYMRAKGDNRFVSVISAISMVGVALGVAVLIIVLSVMNGFETEVRERILGMTAHASLEGYTESFYDWEAAVDIANRHPEVTGAAAFIEGQGMLVNGRDLSGAVIRGVFPEAESQVVAVDQHMIEGRLADLEPGSYAIVLGVALAAKLNVAVGDKVVMIISKGQVTPAGILPRMRRFTVAGVFDAGMYEYDSTLAVVHAADAAKLYRLGDDVTGVRLKLRDMFLAPVVAREVAADLGRSVYVIDWTRKHSNFFKSIQTTKSIMFFILLLVVAVAAFNIVSTLVMVVNEKRADIAIFRTMGSTPRSVLSVFMIQGTIIGLVGTTAGLLLGVLLSANVQTIVGGIERLFGIQFLDATVYFISELPAEIRVSDVAVICATAFTLSLLATVYPAWRAARTQPAEALRYD